MTSNLHSVAAQYHIILYLENALWQITVDHQGMAMILVMQKNF